MSNKGLDELDLKDEELPTADLSDLPDFGAFPDPPPPGPYRFRLPDLDKVWEAYDSVKGQRVRMILDRDYPLTITSPAARAGEMFTTRLSNQERSRGEVEASDLDYLLRAFKVTARPKGNRAYIEAVKQHAGKEFGSDITYSFSCNNTKNIRVFDEADPDKLKEVEGRLGCGKKYYQKDVKQRMPDGSFPLKITCECGAVLRAFANIENIRP